MWDKIYSMYWTNLDSNWTDSQAHRYFWTNFKINKNILIKFNLTGQTPLNPNAWSGQDISEILIAVEMQIF